MESDFRENYAGGPHGYSKWHPRSRDVTAVVVSDDRVRLKLRGGKELAVRAVEGMRFDPKGKLHLRGRLVFSGALTGQQAERTIFEESLGSKEFCGLAEAVVHFLANQARKEHSADA